MKNFLETDIIYTLYTNRIKDSIMITTVTDVVRSPKVEPCKLILRIIDA